MADIQITGFEMLEKLGEGGMASVWKARQVSLDRLVAIKVLAPRFASDPDDVEMFRREAQQAAKLKHPGIVQVYDAGTENGLYYFVMEYIAGYTVGDWVARKGHLGEKDILLLAECVARALEYAWDGSRIIHCDIKPHNVMLDADGSVKVTDLGLARTMNAMHATVESEYILGTPAYMSPEQVTGEADIDFRTDIYSLGTMLYHLSTGQRMFGSEPDERVMELQIEGAVEATHDLNPELSRPFCSLVEKMLAKDPEDRPASWEEVIKDIGRVRKRLRPVGCLQDGQASSVKRSVQRTEPRPQRSTPVKTKSGAPVGRLIALAAVLLALGLIARFVVLAPDKPAAGRRVPVVFPAERGSGNRGAGQDRTVPGEADPSDRTPANREAEAKQKYDDAASWVEANPTRFRTGIERFETVASQTRGTRYASMSSEQARQLKRAWDREIENVMVQLKNDSAPHIAGGDLLRAAELYETYGGAYRKHTGSARLRIASQLRTRHEELNAQKEAAAKRALQKYADTGDALADLLLTQGIAPALARAQQATYDEDLATYRKNITALSMCLESASTMDEKILASFDAQRGQVVSVDFTAGRRTLTIDGVKDGRVQARQQSSSQAVLTLTFGVEKLSTKERLGRMGDDSQHDVALVKGLMAVAAGSETYAKAFFSKTHPLIANRLVALLEGRSSARLDTEAKEALITGLADLGIKVDATFDEGAWTAAIEKVPVTDATARMASEFVESYTSKYGDSQFYEQASAVVESLAQAETRIAETRPKRAARRAASRLSGRIDRAIVKDHKPVDANQIRERLLDDNPEVLPDELEILSDADGYVYRINMYSPGIRSISAVSECKALRVLHCGSVHPRRRPGDERSPLSDLSPIRGLPLEELYLAGTSVKDLGALSGMKLIRLDLRGTKVTSLAPLKYMDLAYINLENVAVRDIADLANMNLEDVDLSGTRVYSFSALRNKSIRRLSLSNTQFKDLSVLRDMPLESLDLANSSVYEFGLLSTLGCKTLNLTGTQIKDVSVLAGMPLTALRIGDVRAKGYEVLRELPLVSLTAAGSSLESLSSVASPSLKNLDVSRTKVSDLTPIAEMPALENLAISHLSIQDLRALSGRHLRRLTCHGFDVNKLRTLIRMGNLDAIICDDPLQSGMLETLFRIPGLMTVNWQPRAHWQ